VIGIRSCINENPDTVEEALGRLLERLSVSSGTKLGSLDTLRQAISAAVAHLADAAMPVR
jgi:hypothetical protein